MNGIKRKKLIVFFSISLLLLIISLSSGALNTKINSISSYFLYPVMIFYKISIKPIISFIEHHKEIIELQNKMELLKDEKNKLLTRAIQAESTLSYIKTTKDLANYAKKFSLEGTIAQIISIHCTANSHYMIVDKGTCHNIKVDMVGIVYNNLLGKITEVYPWYSKLLLITDADCKVAVYGTQTQSHGIHEGTNKIDSSCINFVTLLKPMKQGELILSSGEGMIFPRGFALGKVFSVQKGTIYQQVYMEPLLNLRDLKFCMLISKKEV